MSTQGQVVKYSRGGRRRKDVPDLNIPPVVENTEQAGEPSISLSVAQSAQSEAPVMSIASGGLNQLERFMPPAPIDVEDLDDDVIISSPRAFEEAKKKSRRSQRALVVDVESEEAVIRHVVSQTNKRRRGPPQPIINCDLYVNLEGSSGSMIGRSLYVAPPTPPPPPPPPPPKEPTFTCPVCMGALVEEVTTKCGHIFCKACIMAAIAAQHKCPTCRMKLSNRNIIRVYLPTTK